MYASFSPAQGRNSGTYHGVSLQNPDFTFVKDAPNRSAIIENYRSLRSQESYSNLPNVRSSDAALSQLEAWELDHPSQCSLLRDNGRFFGFTGVGAGYLGKFTKFLRIPAVRDAQDDATEGRGSPITQIMNLVVRNALTNRKELSEFRQRTQEEYSKLMASDNLTELTDLQGNLSKAIQSYVPDAGVILDWSEFTDISFPDPQAFVKLLEDGYESTVDRSGHGLQRAFIITMLQYLAAASEKNETGFQDSSEEGVEETPNRQSLPSFVLAIEEPELYQHPSRQRHIATVLSELASGNIPGVADRTQVIYTSHSPLMVGLDRFDQIRVLRKDAYANDMPKITKMKRVNTAAIAEELWEADGKRDVKYTATTLRPRLQTIMTPWMNEGFFADTVVLVEGEDDRTVILGMARSLGLDFDGSGISVIPCSGKDNIARPYAIFRQLDIPVFVLWDGDYGDNNANPGGNRSLLRILGQPEEDWPDFVKEDCACFKQNLEKTLEGEIGQSVFDQLLAEAQDTLGIRKKKQAIKNVSVIQHIMAGADVKGRSSPTIRKIVEEIVALRAAQDVGNVPRP